MHERHLIGFVLILVGLGLCVMAVLDFVDAEVVDLPDQAPRTPGTTRTLIVAGICVVAGILIASTPRRDRDRVGDDRDRP